MSSATVLVVDDDAATLHVIHTGLKAAGVAVVTACGGEEAVQRFRENPGIRLLLSDVEMPGMDGPAVFAALRQLKPSLRCLFMTGGIPPETGGWQVVAKPFVLSRLASTVTEVLARSQLLPSTDGA